MHRIVLEMAGRPRLAALRPHRSGVLLRVDAPSPRFYRFLLEATGNPTPRSRDVTDDVLAEILAGDAVEVSVLYLGGEPVGCFELEQVDDGVVEVVQFGLVSEHRGGVLERYLMTTAIDAAWERDPGLVRAVLEGGAEPRDALLYQWAGFQVVPDGSAD